jgi:hypothetical protein
MASTKDNSFIPLVASVSVYMELINPVVQSTIIEALQNQTSFIGGVGKVVSGWIFLFKIS